MTIIYVVSGFVGLLLLVVASRGFCVMRNRLREQVSRKPHCQGMRTIIVIDFFVKWKPS